MSKLWLLRLAEDTSSYKKIKYSGNFFIKFVLMLRANILTFSLFLLSILFLIFCLSTLLREAELYLKLFIDPLLVDFNWMSPESLPDSSPFSILNSPTSSR